MDSQLDGNSFGSPLPPSPIIPNFMPHALPATTLPICPGLIGTRTGICWIVYPVAWFYEIKTKSK